MRLAFSLGRARACDFSLLISCNPPEGERMKKRAYSDIQAALAILCAYLMLASGFPARAATPSGAREAAQDQAQAQSQGQDEPDDTVLLTPDQLDDLVSPIALYPDPLVAQILAASTYPLEVVQANRWLQSNSSLQGTALTDAAQNQTWDPSVQALVPFPSVLSMMDKNLSWTTDLGNAFLAQEQDVMDAIQRQRQSAQSSGNLNSNAQQTVDRSTEDGKTVYVIQPAQPEVIYVPVYNPVVIWGPPRYSPWGPFWYPPRPASGFIIGTGPYGFFFSVSIVRYFHYWGGWNSWGWGCGWRGRNVVINNNFYIMNNYRTPHGMLRNGRTVWAHNPNHRAGVPYPSRRVAQRIGAPVPRPRPMPGGGRPGQPGGNRPGQPGQPGGNRPGQPVTRPSPQPGRPGQPSIQPVPNPGQPGGNRPGTRPAPQPGQPNRPGQPSIQPVPSPGRPGTTRPAPGTPSVRPMPAPVDRSALGRVNTPGDRAQIERDRGYGSLGNRAAPPKTTTPARPAAPARPAPSRPSGATPRPR